MRYSESFIPTLREIPKEAETRSHVLMLRAGLMRKLAAGLYTFLPLGKRSLAKVERIIREEMDRAGALEVLMPALQPDDLWKQSGRWDLMGPELMRIRDRGGREFVLGPTHEEIITDLVAHGITSYRDLPKNLYQIQPKFRDEIRPRFGLVRAREFIMKDAYSFDRDIAGLDRSYERMYEAYERVFTRCGLSIVAVMADTGFMGGKYSHEFMAPTEMGEAVIAVCGECGYAANQEICPCAPPEPATGSGKTVPPVEKVDTPDMRTIEEITAFLGCRPEDCIKTLIYETEKGAVAILLRGDREANEVKIANYLGTAVQMAAPEVIQQATGAPVGFAGPVGLEGVRVVADPEVMLVADGVTGANDADAHYRHVVPGRDFTSREVADMRLCVEGDRCPKCGRGTFALSRGTEVGQVFKLGTKYSEALGAYYVDEHGASHPMVMGCYGIGVTRTLATVIEQNCDAKGIVWPVSTAPYHVHVLPVSTRDEKLLAVADGVYRELHEAGIETLIDDRPESPGVKFNDADLLGLPLRITVGRAVKEGAVELVERKSGNVAKVPISEVAAAVRSRLDAMETDESHPRG